MTDRQTDRQTTAVDRRQTGADRQLDDRRLLAGAGSQTTRFFKRPQ